MGRVTKAWRQASVPIFEKEVPVNYRTVGLKLIPRKVLEQITKWSVYEHLQNTGVISRRQHGFVKNKLYQKNTILWSDTVTNRVVCGYAVGIAYLVFSKTFYEVSLWLKW